MQANVGISRQFPNEEKPRLLSRDSVLRVQGSWINRIFLPRIEVVEGSATHRRHLNVIMYRNVTLSIRGKTLKFEVNYKHKVVLYMVEVCYFWIFEGEITYTNGQFGKQSETEDACRELHDIIEELRREENNKGRR